MASRPLFSDPNSTEVIEEPADDRPDKPKEPADGPVKTGRKRRWRRTVIIVLSVLVLLAGGGALAATLYVRSVDHDIKRIEAFEAVPEAARPPKVEAAKDALNFLVLGSDSRDPENAGGSRSDTIIVLHLTKDRSSAQMVSIPRDTWVHIPPTKDGKRGNADAKINAAFAWGGVPLMVQTVENYTKVRIDHVAMVDFAGFKEIVDALGGVDIDVEESFTSTHSLNANSIRQFHKGPQTMDGAAALDYARERFAFRDGDFARIRHQQQVIKAILNKAASGGTLTNPGRLNAFLRATADAVSVDGTLNIFDMATELRHLRSDNLNFYTSPSKGTGTIGDQSVVLPDPTKAKALFEGVRRDDLAAIRAAGG